MEVYMEKNNNSGEDYFFKNEIEDIQKRFNDSIRSKDDLKYILDLLCSFYHQKKADYFQGMDENIKKKYPQIIEITEDDEFPNKDIILDLLDSKYHVIEYDSGIYIIDTRDIRNLIKYYTMRKSNASDELCELRSISEILKHTI